MNPSDIISSTATPFSLTLSKNNRNDQLSSLMASH